MRSEDLRNTLTYHVKGSNPKCWLSGSSQGKLLQKGQSGAGGDSKVLPDKGHSPTLSEEGVCVVVQTNP